MTDITLYSGPLSMFGAKVQIALQEKGVSFDLVMVLFGMTTMYEPRHPEVLRINPKRQVPVLIHRQPDGNALELYDSTQIFEYLEDLKADVPLWPRGIADRMRARKLEHESDEVYFPPVIRLMGLQDTPDDPAAVKARAACAAFYATMEGLLSDRREWLNGADYTFADIAFFMAQIFGTRMGAAIEGGSAPHLVAWRARMTQRPAVRQVGGAMTRWLLDQGRRPPEFMMDMVG